MDALLVITALALPALVGGLWLNLLVPMDTVARLPLVWGLGTLLGLVLIPQFLWALDIAGVPLAFWPTATLCGGLILLALGIQLARGDNNRTPPRETDALRDLPVYHKLLFVGLLTLVIVRIVTLGLEVYWRPLFPWDATMHWASKGRVWFEHRTLVPFVSNAEWLAGFGKGVYTDEHPGYLPTIPLLQVWVNLSINRWDESLMNLPWVMCFVALGAALYGQLRNAGGSPAVSMVFTYFLMSMPLINTHVALAGYADLFLGATFCGALMAMHNWTLHRQGWQLVLMVIFAAAGMRLKTEGFLWTAALVPGLIVATASSTRRGLAWLAAIGLVGLLLLFVFRQFSPDALHPFLQQFTPFSKKGLMGIIKSGWLHDNWHLFTYLFPAILALSVFLPRVVLRQYRGIATSLAMAFGAFLFMFLFTIFWMGAANFTGVGRISIQLIPSLLFFCALLGREFVLLSEEIGKVPGGKTAST